LEIHLKKTIKARRDKKMTLEEMYGNAKALVEDRTYNIGEISEKTGLQKTANGWVKPKSNKGAKKDASEKGMSKHWVQKGEEAAFVERTPQEEKEMWKKVAARQSDEKLQLAIKNRQGKDLSPIEKIKLETAKAELEKRNSNSAQEELIKLEKERRSYGDDSKNDYAGHKIRLKQADLLNKAGFKDRKEFDKFYENQNKKSENPYALSKEEKNEAMKNPKTRLSQKYDEVIKSKKGTPQYNTALEEYTKERESYKNSQGVEALKEFPVVPISKDSACRITADTKIRLKK
jgi:hypothetical protein